MKKDAKTHALEVCHEIFSTMADPEKSMHKAMHGSKLSQWGDWRDYVAEVLKRKD